MGLLLSGVHLHRQSARRPVCRGRIRLVRFGAGFCPGYTSTANPRGDPSVAAGFDLFVSGPGFVRGTPPPPIRAATRLSRPDSTCSFWGRVLSGVHLRRQSARRPVCRGRIRLVCFGAGFCPGYTSTANPRGDPPVAAGFDLFVLGPGFVRGTPPPPIRRGDPSVAAGFDLLVLGPG